ncbi:hypothetical protein MTP09_08350 [Chryseobacterium suipulveris]|uniref:GNAT family N-acetyltransferase n=1 Tax=Chryseobacterium suipulveris TaxID=2929800 RepID=A0ABY4BL69_9FLAO|nr:hypothetical protein [Chryseobacterium suipulveris]UOE39937.1 hypothetical protein MTP09_08350 [Chryseobacterium suipulveris]
MIKKLKYSEIDFVKYGKCIDQSVQKNFYAQREILDEVCESWELLVSGDYDFVMPVPIKKKFGFHFVLMPLFCQQLGIFGKETDEKMEGLFVDFLKKNYKIVNYYFNFQNKISSNFKHKKNYFIETTEYKLLRKHYFKGRKSTVKTAQYLNFKELNLAENLDFIRNNFKGLDKKSDVEKLFGYMNFLDRQKKLRVFGSFKDEQITNSAIVIDHDNSLSLLGLVNDEKYRLDNGASFLIDRILQENIQSKSFDFMGGTIRGIEVFFKSFGAERQEYPIIENSKTDLLRNFFIK